MTSEEQDASGVLEQLLQMNATLTSLKGLVEQIVGLLSDGPEESEHEESEEQEDSDEEEEDSDEEQDEDSEEQEDDDEEEEDEDEVSHTVESAQAHLKEAAKYPRSRRGEINQKVNSTSGDVKRVWRRLLERCDALTVRCTVTDEKLSEMERDGTLDSYVAELEQESEKLASDIDDKLGEPRRAARHAARREAK